MQTRDYRDIIGGAALIALGVFCAVHAAQNLPLGTVTHMGPGMFPMALGYILAGLGVLVAVPALFRPGRLPQPDYRSLAAVLVSTLLFALTIRTAGLVPAIVLLTLAAVLADNKLRFVEAALLSAALSLLAVLIFRVGLGMPIQPFIWPSFIPSF
ncbi:tripartite tricarboxylate transporter TctB family protein [Pseudorhodoplanes sinuspersici]|uniref:Uncharacterized protein n=1 Tax=Pseudorhodoplanes sinuspersici TaxID=1235591 RepID=A0A1W6ZVS1_9HYPH|nr:tripartite tricarboxylate transporter TctB family protein [Pseudorhodoplanes sinuspersici]ARQ01368.1 hypothetical protein CAK95_21385 [Pseudorhodoplanes sinuspersici]RKE73051.1 tripartite tricarboxylate transporter TctB family protein [Pseudorhodoplanes sinuspersici]